MPRQSAFPSFHRSRPLLLGLLVLLLDLVWLSSAFPFSSYFRPPQPQRTEPPLIQQGQQQQQLVFESHRPHNHQQQLPPHVPEQRPDEFLTLRHILHRGGHRYPGLSRRLDLSPMDILLTELLTGESLTHRLKVKSTTTLRPRTKDDNDQEEGTGAMGWWKKTKKPKKSKTPNFRGRGFRSLGLMEDQSFGPESWTREVVDAPDTTDKETIVQLSKMNYNSYTEVASPGWYDLEGNWGVVSIQNYEEQEWTPEMVHNQLSGACGPFPCPAPLFIRLSLSLFFEADQDFFYFVSVLEFDFWMGGGWCQGSCVRISR